MFNAKQKHNVKQICKVSNEKADKRREFFLLIHFVRGYLMSNIRLRFIYHLFIIVIIRQVSSKRQ